MTFDKLIPWKRDKRSAPMTRAHPIADLHDEVGRMFENFFSGGALAFPDFESSSLGGAFAPRLDVSETDAEVRVEAELPGVLEKDIELSYADGALTLHGERESIEEDSSRGYTTRERRYGSFQRVVQMPAEIDEDGIDARFKNGVLVVRCPKAADRQRTIPVTDE